MVEKKNVQEMYNLPSEVRYCKKCTITNQRPRITFNEEGVCTACQFAQHKNSQIDWINRGKELAELCDRFRKNDGSFDVIVPFSGGKDSSFVAHKLKYEFGMNPLTVTWAPHIYTDIGWKNFQSSIHTGGFHNITGTPDGIIHRKLTKLAFEILGDPFQPFIYGQTNFPLQIAIRYKIPFLMYGENGEVEYGGDMKNAFSPTRDYKSDHKKHYFSGLSPEDLVDYGIKKTELKAYMAPSDDELDSNGTEIHFFSYYHKWNPAENKDYCIKNTGYFENPVRSEGTYSKFASLDDKLDGFHYYLSYMKFGIGRATADTAHEIRDGYLTREEGLKLVKEYDGEFPKKFFKDFLDYCSISEEYFWEVMDSWRSHHLWEKENDEWNLRFKIT